jgi:hypothetical protein
MMYGFLGIKGSKPEWSEMIIEPHPLELPDMRGQLHTPVGLVSVSWKRIITEEQLESMISLRLQALAEAAWTVDRDYDDFLRRLKLHMQANITQLHALPLEEVALTDEQAMIQALRLMKTMASETKDSIQDTGLSAEEHQRISGMFSWRRCSAGSIRERSPPGMV